MLPKVFAPICQNMAELLLAEDKAPVVIGSSPYLQRITKKAIPF